MKRKIEAEGDPCADAAAAVVKEDGSLSSLAVFGNPQDKENAPQLLAPYGILSKRCVFVCCWRLHARMYTRVHARTHARTHAHAGRPLSKTIPG
jgi:hypothetical protein